MVDLNTNNSPFLSRVITVIEAHLDEEAFGVAELAEEMNMSRSTLLRKVKSSTGLSAALFIRQVRLRHAKELLKNDSLTISEIAFKVGFSSSSYFAKCFRDEYGYSPSEESNQESTEIPTESLNEAVSTPSNATRNWHAIAVSGGLILVIVIGFLVWPSSEKNSQPSPKTIAVLPFQNDSPDSSNVYFINGFMMALIDNLHQVQNLQVTSRTTVEQYRGVNRTATDLAEELGVSYLVEGSGQKIDDQILLTLHLIDARADTLMWSRRFQRETTDIFQLQTEISTSIVQEIEVMITPEEQKRIALAPTENLVAYDHYLKGREQIRTETREGLIAGIASFQQAIAEDDQFALPYAYLAISYYFLDLFQPAKPHLEDINTYADKALLLNPDLDESLLGKGLYYMHSEKYELAIEFFDKVLARSSDTGWIHNLLSTIYVLHLPNTERYLHHTIQGIPYAVAGKDSVTISMAYMHLGNALTQNGFLTEAKPYLEKSLRYQPNNLFAEMVAISVELGQNNDLDQAYQSLQALLAKDSTFLATLQEIAKIAYYKGEYEISWNYYHRFLEIKQASGLNIYPGEDIRIAHVLAHIDRPAEAAAYRESYLAYIQEDASIYRYLGYAMYYTSTGEKDKAITYLQTFSEQEGYPLALVMLLDQDPILETLRADPVYRETVELIKERFWDQHGEIRSGLEGGI